MGWDLRYYGKKYARLNHELTALSAVLVWLERYEAADAEIQFVDVVLGEPWNIFVCLCIFFRNSDTGALNH